MPIQQQLQQQQQQQQHEDVVLFHKVAPALCNNISYLIQFILYNLNSSKTSKGKHWDSYKCQHVVDILKSNINIIYFL